MPVLTSGLPGSALPQRLNQHQPETLRDIPVKGQLTAGSKLRISGLWLKQQTACLTAGQQRLAKLALAALEGKEPLAESHADERGGQFSLQRPTQNATHVSFQRAAAAPELLSYLRVDDCEGNALLTLGDAHPALPAVPPKNPDYRADEKSILMHSRASPAAGWQHGMFIVPFMTKNGERARVVGDYVTGDSLRFAIKNAQGEHYATLKRTQTENGDFVWMLPVHASLSGGSGGREIIAFSSSDGNGKALAATMQVTKGRDAATDSFINHLLAEMSARPASDSRAADAIGILKLIKDDHNQGEDFTFMMCSHNDKPIGLMVAQQLDQNEVYIHHVVADGRYPGTAKAMMQKAATQAIAHSAHGRVTLTPLNDAVAETFETKYGFNPVDEDDDDYLGDEDDLILEPTNSPLWHSEAGGEATLK